MCRPSANRAIEWNLRPKMISAIIIAAVRIKTRRVFFSAEEKSAVKSWLCFQREMSVVCMVYSFNNNQTVKVFQGSRVPLYSVVLNSGGEFFSATRAFMYL